MFGLSRKGVYFQFFVMSLTKNTHTHSLSLSVGGYKNKNKIKKKSEEKDRIENDAKHKNRWKQKINEYKI